MRIEILGAGHNARHVHPVGAGDLLHAPSHRLAQGSVAIALPCVPRRSIQLRRAETRVTLSVAEVFALFHDVTAELGLTWSEVREGLEAVRRTRDVPAPPGDAEAAGPETA
jgi:hypothetical protein